MLHAFIWIIYLAGLAAILITQNTLMAIPAYATALGWVLLVSGCALLFYSKQWLGRHYQRVPKLTKGHMLVTDGPYTYVRHPEYVGMIIAFAGLCILESSFVGLLFWALIFIPLHAMLGYQEEKLLAKNYGAEHKRYRERAGLFLPRTLTFWYPWLPKGQPPITRSRQR